MTEGIEPQGDTASPADQPKTFEEMNLDPAVRQALDEMGYEVPMEVQTAIYARAVAGKDLMVQSRTGSGKTAAFGIPIAQLLPPGTPGVQALILAPTRELALQVSQEMGKICAYRNLQVVPVYGGAPMGKQITALKEGAQIIAGTPGRVLDHIRRGTFRTENVKILVLDECDEMLSMGFQEEIEKIITELPPKDQRQTMLFSATIPEEIERIGRRHMREYEKVVLSADFIGVHEIAHRYYLVSGLGRTRDLLKVLESEQPETALIFCNTRDDTAMVASFLGRHGFDAEAISSDLTQSDRERVMGRMRQKDLKFLVATDIAARGIDISDLGHVINYTFPESPEVYIHRTGRTGRAGKSGTAISLIGPREIGSFYYLKLLYKIKPEERELPTESELRTRREGERYSKVADEVKEDPADEWHSLARRVWDSGEGERIVAALLKRVVEGAPAMIATKAPAEAITPRPAAERHDDRPREDRPREDRPRDERRTRERGERDRGRGGDRDRGRGGDRDRGRGGDRDRRPPARAGEPSRADKPAGEAPAGGGGGESSGREFWETWVDEKAQETAPGVPNPAEGVSEAAPDREARERRPRRERPELPPEEPGFVRLYVNVGKREGLSDEDVTRLAKEASPEPEAIGKVLVMGTHSYVSVKEEQAGQVMASLMGKKVGEREVLVERARK